MITHPAAELFPMMDGDEFDGLVQDIKTKGLIEPLWVAQDGRLLDGRNRLKACQVVGIEPKTRTYTGSDPIGFVVSLNLARRHLTAGQKGMLALQVMAAYEEQNPTVAKESGKLGGQIAGNGRPKSRGSADRHYPKKQGPRSADKAAAVVGVSGRVVARARRVKEGDPELAKKVANGDLPLDKAEKQVARKKKEAEEQQARKIVMAEVHPDAKADGWMLFHGDVSKRVADIPAGSVDLIVTDPPYPEESLPLWDELATAAAQVLKPQGVLVALTGIILFPEVISALKKSLAWGWMYIQPLPGANSRIMGRHVLQSYKPWVAFSNGKWPSGSIDWHPDVLDASSRSKDRYRWEQDPNPAKMLIDALCPSGGTVLDPFNGTASYGVAAIEMGRKYIGIEKDAARFKQSADRLLKYKSSK